MAAATKADWILGCICRWVSSRVGGVIIPLSAGKATSVGRCPGLVPAIQGDLQRRVTKMIKGLENLVCEGKVKVLPQRRLGGPHHSVPVLKGQRQRR